VIKFYVGEYANMFFRKDLRNAEREIKKENLFLEGSEGDAIISVKAEESEKLFSSYSFDSSDKLNPDLGEFIWDRAKFVPSSKDIKIKIYTNDRADDQEIKTAIKNHFKEEYVENKNNMKQKLYLSLAMFFAGLFCLSILLLQHTFFYNEYVEYVIDIATWVFFWEAIDVYFIERSKNRKKCAILLKLCMAEIEVVKLKKLNKKRENV